MFALLECVCEPTLSHQKASIKPLQKCGPYMHMAVLIRVNRFEFEKSKNKTNNSLYCTELEFFWPKQSYKQIHFNWFRKKKEHTRNKKHGHFV